MSDLSKETIQREIEAKKKKLEELKLKRLSRQQKHAGGASSSSSGGPGDDASSPTFDSTGSGSGSSSFSVTLSPPSSSSSLSSSSSSSAVAGATSTGSSTHDILDVVNSLLTSSTSSSAVAAAAVAAAAAASGAASGAATAGGPAPSSSSSATAASVAPSHHTVYVPAPRPTLSVVELANVNIASAEKIFYDAMVQTTESALVQIKHEEEKQKQRTKRAAGAGARGKGGAAGAAAAAAAAEELTEEEEIRMERDALRLRETELMQTIRELRETMKKAEEAEAQRQPKPLTSSEQEQIVASSEFQSFLSRSSLLMERILSIERSSSSSGARRGANYDFMVDYTADDDDDRNANKSQKEDSLQFRFAFSDDGRTIGRPVSAIDWSPKYPELLLAAYASMDEDDLFSSLAASSIGAPSAGTGSSTGSSSSSFADNAQGCVLLWNCHMQSRPEHHFTADSAILNAWFHPLHAKLVLGATHTGQLVMWDTRQKTTPVNRTSLSNSHTHPIYACHMLPTVNGSYNIVSVSTDGQACIWNESNLHAPIHSTFLRGSSIGGAGGVGGSSAAAAAAAAVAAAAAAGVSGSSLDGSSLLSSSSTSTSAAALGLGGLGGLGLGGLGGRDIDLTVNCLSFLPRDNNTMLCGSDEGHIYKARVHESKDGVFDTIYYAHDAPITSLSFHPGTAVTKAPSHLGTSCFLSSSYDWTVKLWNNHQSTQPIHTFEASRDYVYDAAWHPLNPALFVCGDCTGKLDVWNLSHDWDVPEFSTIVGKDYHAALSSAKNGDSDGVGGPSTASTPGGNGSGVGGSGGAGGVGVGGSGVGGSSTPSLSSRGSVSIGSSSAASVGDLATELYGGSGTLSTNAAISRLRWNAGGSMLAVGTSHGQVMVYEVSQSLSDASDDAQEQFWEKLGKKLNTVGV